MIMHPVEGKGFFHGLHLLNAGNKINQLIFRFHPVFAHFRYLAKVLYHRMIGLDHIVGHPQRGASSGRTAKASD
jgi:hypothetical protein